MVERQIASAFRRLAPLVRTSVVKSGAVSSLDPATGEMYEQGYEYPVSYILMQKSKGENTWTALIRSNLEVSKNDKLGTATVIDTLIKVGDISMVRINAEP
jgi:predicted acetyltransferase